MNIKFITEQEEKEISYNPINKKNLLEIALESNIELDHSCGGNAACSTCHIKIKSGMKYLNEIDDIEEDLVDFAENPELTSRLACQCIPKNIPSSNLIVEIPEQKGLH